MKKYIIVIMLIVLAYILGAMVMENKMTKEYNAAEQVRRAERAEKQKKIKISTKGLTLIEDGDFEKSKIGLSAYGAGGDTTPGYKSSYNYQFSLGDDLAKYDYTLGKTSADHETITLYPDAGKLIVNDVKEKNEVPSYTIWCDDVCTGDETIVVSDKDGNYLEAYLPYLNEQENK